jgi:hypothetical protein
MVIGKGAAARRVLVDVIAASNEAEVIWGAQLKRPLHMPAIGPGAWAFRCKVFLHDLQKPLAPERLMLLIKYRVLREERQWEKIERQVRAFENLSQAEVARRERIPETVRLFVWQRDEGKCVRCGSEERLEFDHIIPVIEGGSSTERNVQLLCESCNRSKGRGV